ncbi:MAG: hypothetical protein ACYTXI_37185 [Nostoc sp.]
MEPLASELNQPKSKLESASTLIKRFSAGATIGLIIAAIQWGNYTHCFDAIPLTRGIMFCLGLTIICGLMTLKWGYKTLESLLQLLG